MRHEKIMIVDDNQTVLAAASSALKAAGFQVVTRDQAIGTTVVLMRERPQLVLVDVNMPALEGHDLVRSIKKRGILRDIVVLLYSAQPVEKLSALADECDADGFICKSTPAKELTAVVTRWLDQRRQDLVPFSPETAPEIGPRSEGVSS